jgi:protein-S-isoprenylcysteine O-methyltransferase Ste14
MRKSLIALYSTVAYALFLGVFLYFIGFVEGVAVPKTIDSGAAGSTIIALSVDAGLLTLFALQHSIMARAGFKRVWTRVIAPEAERSTYVVFATAFAALLCWKWQPMPQLVWAVSSPVATYALRAISWSGWGLLLLSTFLINHFHLFGLSQGFAKLLGLKSPEPTFTTPFLYRYLRHPLYAGFILAFWAAPRMTVGHLFFAIATFGYILVGIWFEERDLTAYFGDRYRSYQSSVGMLLPKLRLHAPGKRTVHSP